MDRYLYRLNNIAFIYINFLGEIMHKYLFIFLSFLSIIVIFSEETSAQEKKLEYFIGTWESKGVTESSGKESIATSVVEKVIGGKWLMWTFSAEMSWGPLEVFTLINYDDAKKHYAFYSYNPIDEEPIPHFGNWEVEGLLRLETDFGGKNVRVEFQIENENHFTQIHSKLGDNNQYSVTSKTYYSRIK